MASYYVDLNARTNGYHEVHRWQCGNIPRLEGRYYLGEHDDEESAIRKARDVFSFVMGCPFCTRQD